jgi:hypothetical protein
MNRYAWIGVLVGLGAVAGIVTLSGQVTPPGPVPVAGPTPMLVWVGTDYQDAGVTPQQIKVQSRWGSSATMSVTLSDGTYLTATSPLTIDFTIAGRGGLDTGSINANTWYYFYAVKAATVGQFAGIASVTAPSGAGPTGYTTAWKYLGAALTNNSSQIIPMQQIGSKFLYLLPLWDSIHAFTNGTDATPQIQSLAATMPATASSALIYVRVTPPGGSGSGACQLWSDVSQIVHPAYSGVYMEAFEISALPVQFQGPLEIPLPNATKQIWYQRTTVSMDLIAQGWIDGYVN